MVKRKISLYIKKRSRPMSKSRPKKSLPNISTRHTLQTLALCLCRLNLFTPKSSAFLASRTKFVKNSISPLLRPRLCQWCSRDFWWFSHCGYRKALRRSLANSRRRQNPIRQILSLAGGRTEEIARIRQQNRIRQNYFTPNWAQITWHRRIARKRFG